MEIRSTSELLQYLYSISLDNIELRFRGQADRSWNLIPSIYRYSNFSRYQTTLYEDILLQMKPKTPQPPLTHTTYDLEWLMLCQHYGIPTRLMDWSFDILTALFFACFDSKLEDKDGSIIICRKNDYPLFSEYEHTISKKKELAFINTNIVNPRMRNQFGCFMMWGRSPIDDSTTETYDLFEYQNCTKSKYFSEELIIPANSKICLLSELNKYYSISYENIYIKNGYLELKYSKGFEELKNIARLKTLYLTNAEGLIGDEKNIARKYFSVDCENMYKGCINLR